MTVSVSLSVGTLRLEPQIEAIINSLNKIGIIPKVILATHEVLDPIGTKMAIEAASKFSQAYAVIAKKGSYTRAYLAGLEKAASLGATYVVSMDADGSHDPEELQEFVRELEKFDVVLSSRNIPGAKNDYPFQRKLISWVGTLFANHILGMKKIQKLTDFTSGFEGMRVSVVRDIFRKYPPERWEATQHAYHLQNTLLRVCILSAGYSVKEIPIHYGKHRVGKTLGFKYLWGAFRGFLSLVFEKNKIKRAFE